MLLLQQLLETERRERMAVADALRRDLEAHEMTFAEVVNKLVEGERRERLALAEALRKDVESQQHALLQQDRGRPGVDAERRDMGAVEGLRKDMEAQQNAFANVVGQLVSIKAAGTKQQQLHKTLEQRV